MIDHPSSLNGAGKSAREIWETAKGTLQVQVNKANFDTWLKDTVGISLREDQFIVGTPKAFAKEWLERRLSSLVEKTLIGIVGHEVEVTFQVCASPDPIPDNPRTPRQSQRPYQSRLPLPKLNPRYTFETFVVGDSNRLAYAAAVGVAEEPGNQHNPLFIFGDSGLGKTHLAHAIGNEACRDGLVVAYASGEQFTNEFVDAIVQGFLLGGQLLDGDSGIIGQTSTFAGVIIHLGNEVVLISALFLKLGL